GRPRGGGVEQYRDRGIVSVRDDQVGLAIAVDVRGRHRVRHAASGEGLLGGEAERGRPEAVVLSSTDTLLKLRFDTIRSGLPSPLMSATVTELGKPPVAKVCWAAKLGVVAPGVVVLSSTETFADGYPFATIRSGLPSPLTSATVTE